MEEDLFLNREAVISAFNLDDDLSNEDILKVLKEKIQDCHPDKVEGKENEAKRVTAAINCMRRIIKEEQGEEMLFPIRAFDKTMVKFSEELAKVSLENQEFRLDNKKIALEEKAQGFIRSYRSKMTAPAICSSLIWGFMAIWVIFPKFLSENPWIPQVTVTREFFLGWLGILLFSFVLWGFKYFHESRVKDAISYLNLENNRIDLLRRYLYIIYSERNCHSEKDIPSFPSDAFIGFVCANLCRKMLFMSIRSLMTNDLKDIPYREKNSLYGGFFVRPLFRELIENEIVHNLLQQTLEKATYKGILTKSDDFLYDKYTITPLFKERFFS